MHTVDAKFPPHYELLNGTIYEPLNWDLAVNFRKTPTQTYASYKENILSIRMCVESINSYLYLMNTGFVKNIIIAGFTGGGKTFFMMYIVIYALSKGLTVIIVAMMCHREIQFGG